MEASAKDIDTFARDVTNIIREIMPDSAIFITIKASNFDAGRRWYIGDGSHLFAGELEKIREIDWLIINRNLKERLETSVDETRNAKTVFLASLAPDVAINRSMAKELISAFITDWREGNGGSGGDWAGGDGVGAGRDFLRRGLRRRGGIWADGGDGVDALAFGLGFFAERFNLTVVGIAVAIKILLEVVHGFDVVV